MEAAGTRGEIEDELLQMAEYLDEGTSRLGCQIRLSHAHHGIRVTLAPEE
jgi:ferredoxin